LLPFGIIREIHEHGEKIIEILFLILFFYCEISFKKKISFTVKLFSYLDA